MSCLGLKKALKKRDTLTFTPDTAPNVVSRFLSLSLSLSLSVGERECEREKRRRERERERERIGATVRLGRGVDRIRSD